MYVNKKYYNIHMNFGGSSRFPVFAAWFNPAPFF